MTTERSMTLAQPVLIGIAACAMMLALYFGIVGLISGLDFARDEFLRFRYYLSALAIGFGMQVGLYVHLRNLVSGQDASTRVLAVSGTTSTAAMVSCCTHYLLNVLPVIGVTGLLTFVAQYQIEFFWLGLTFNAAGIFYIARKVLIARKEHAKC
ncbi:hypothetical protein [Sideroxyarcus sp. TK5]